MKFELEPDNRGMPDEVLLEDLCSVARKLGKEYVTKEEYNQHGRWCAATFQKRFGSWCEAHKRAGLKKIRNYDATAEDCVRDIECVAKKLGKTAITNAEYERYGTFSLRLISRRCGSWESAIAQAGLTLSPLYHKRVTDEQLFENLEHIWEALGRQPRRPDFVKPLSKYCYDVYPNRFGSFRKALEAFVTSYENQETKQSEKSTSEDALDPIPVVVPKCHKISRTIGWRMRFLVLRRDDFKCRLCGNSPALKPGLILHVDHIIPWSEGGETVMDNLQTLCERCNIGKSNLPIFENGTQ
jgi:5-methylcytosine-specific restriction endonuclease McrA